MSGRLPASRGAGRLPTWAAALPLLLLAALLRAVPLLANRFHPDEALYAWFARLIATGRDFLLAGLPVDKPPLSFYLGAFSLRLIDDGEFGVRLPTYWASVVSVALLYALGRRLYGQRSAWLAAALLAVSPFAILFSITIFIDPLLTAAVLWALWAASYGRWRWMATALAIGFATKQTTLLFVPLALGVGLCGLPATAGVRQAAVRLWRASWPVAVGLLLASLFIFGWDTARGARIGFWTVGYEDNMPNRFVRAGEVLPRAEALLDLLRYVTASPPLNVALALGLPLALLIRLGRRAATRGALADMLFSAYVLLYLAAYWLLAFNIWDRYLLPLVPLLALLLARVLVGLGQAVGQRLPAAPAWLRPMAAGGLGLALAVCLWLPAQAAVRSAYPIGGDHGAYDGIDDVAGFLRSKPKGTVLYDHWLSWHWNFYLYDSPVYVAWFPTPQALTTDLKAFGRSSPRFLVVPAWESDAELRQAAAAAGFTFVEVHQAYHRDGGVSFNVYALQPAGQGVSRNWAHAAH